MSRWDEPRGPRHENERDRWRRDRMPEPGAERRSFAEEDWRRERRYGPRFEDAGEAGYSPRPSERGEAERQAEGFTHGGEPWAYAGQEYGLEGHSGGAGGGPGWGLQRGSERWRNFDFDDPGVNVSQAGYGSAAQTHPDRDFDADYLRWREQQLRAHDRDYQDWRREQQRRYDEQYRQFRSERQRHFGLAFHEWRAQRGQGGDRGPEFGKAPPQAPAPPDAHVQGRGQGRGDEGRVQGEPRTR